MFTDKVHKAILVVPFSETQSCFKAQFQL